MLFGIFTSTSCLVIQQRKQSTYFLFTKTNQTFLREIEMEAIFFKYDVSIQGCLLIKRQPFTMMKRGNFMKLYTKTICPKCLWVKSELERAGLDAEIVNIDHDEQAKQTIMDAGFLSVPVLAYNGTFIGDVQEIVSQIELIAQ